MYKKPTILKLKSVYKSNLKIDKCTILQKKNNAGKGTIPFYNYTMVIKQELNKVSVDTTHIGKLIFFVFIRDYSRYKL